MKLNPLPLIIATRWQIMILMKFTLGCMAQLV